MRKVIITISVCTMLLSCCTTKSTESNSGTKEVLSDSIKTPHLLGGDRDEHGCIPSAGYIWCEKLGKCIRPWEEKCE